MTLNAGDIIYQIVVFGLFILFFVSLILFIRRFLVNSTGSYNRLRKIEEKLDRLIEIMEKDRS